MKTTYVHEGVTFDLGLAHQDVFGGEWTWTGTWTTDDEPLMRSRTAQPGCSRPSPLPDVYQNHGPLIPIRPRTLPTAAEYRAAIDPNYADSVARGLYETPQKYSKRMAHQPAPVPAPAPVPTAPGHVLVSSPLEQTGFRSFINSLRGGA